MRCDGCNSWRRGTRTSYGDGSVREDLLEQPRCAMLNIVTAADFGCVHYADDAGGQMLQEAKAGAPWQNWRMVPCPDCRAAGNAGDGACGRCTGTGNVRAYDDGYVGDERTRRHPKEVEAAAGADPGTVLAPVPAAGVV